VANPVIAIAGSSGLIGSALAAALRAADHPVLRIVRRTPSNSEELHWNPESGEFDVDAADAVARGSPADCRGGAVGVPEGEPGDPVAR